MNDQIEIRIKPGNRQSALIEELRELLESTGWFTRLESHIVGMTAMRPIPDAETEFEGSVTRMAKRLKNTGDS